MDGGRQQEEGAPRVRVSAARPGRDAVARTKAVRRKSPLLFPGRASMDTPISNMTFNQALARMGYKGRQTPTACVTCSAQRPTRPGRNGASWIAPLAHKVRGTEGVYNKAQYLAQRRELMQWWANRLDALAADLAGVRAA